MKVSFIVAVDNNWAIGKNNKLPWVLPGDLKKFKQITMGHHLIMGRKTYDSIGRPLPGRTMLVLTREERKWEDKTFFFRKMVDALKYAKENGDDEVFIVGGGEIFSQFLHIAQRIYLTRVHMDADGDAFFPKINFDEWNIVKEENYPQDEENPLDWTFFILERKS